MLAGTFLGTFLTLKHLILLLASGTALGCRAADGPEASSSDAKAAYATDSSRGSDSVLSMDTLVRRFQAGMPRPDSLGGTASSPAALTGRYLDAVRRFDTTALRVMHISRAEYAYLYFPHSKMMKPPYELPPDAAWLLHTAESNKGIAAVMRRLGGHTLELEGVRCPGESFRDGPNIVWRNCLVRYREPGAAPVERPLFAAIIERDGRFKFFSYATSL